MSGHVRSFQHDFSVIVGRNATKTALVIHRDVDPLELTYQQVAGLMDRYLAFFQHHGLKPGDVIFSLMPNTAETLILFLATLKGGYGLAPVPCTASRREVERWIRLVRPKLCCTTRLIREDIRAAVRSRMPTVEVETDGGFAWLPKEGLDGPLGDSPRLYLSTSGTTGEPKAMVLDGLRLWSSGHAFLRVHGALGSSLRFWNYLPMAYLGGLFNLGLIPLCAEGSVVIDEPFSGKTFLTFWPTVDRFSIDAVWLVPSIVKGLLAMARRGSDEECHRKGGRIHKAFLGTAPIDLATKQTFEETFGLRLLENFALSETTFFTTETPDNLDNRKEGSVGEVLPYADLKLVASQDQPTDQGREIRVKTPFLFLGYLDDEGRVQCPEDEEGYFPTGDLGYLDETNTLVITGRRRDIIKKGGYFVSLREIECLAEQHQGVETAAAVRVPHRFYGESFVLYVKPRDAQGAGLVEDLSGFIHQNVVKYKWPEKIVVKGALPVTSTGKVQKHLLKEDNDA